MNFWSYHRALLDSELEKYREYFSGVVVDIGGGQKRGDFIRFNKTDFVIVDTYLDYYPTILADAHRLPIKSGVVDCVKMTEMIHYLSDPQAAIDEAYRILKPSGVLILSSPWNVGSMLDFTEKQRYSEDILRELLTMFTIVEIKKQGLFFTVIGNMLKQGILSVVSRFRYLLYLTIPLIDVMVKLDTLRFVKSSPYLSSYTTGYFIVARKEKK